MKLFILIFYDLILLLLSIFEAHRYYTMYLFIKHSRNKVKPKATFKNLPKVTIQLPISTEQIERVLKPVRWKMGLNILTASSLLYLMPILCPILTFYKKPYIIKIALIQSLNNCSICQWYLLLVLACPSTTVKLSLKPCSIKKVISTEHQNIMLHHCTVSMQ